MLRAISAAVPEPVDARGHEPVVECSDHAAAAAGPDRATLHGRADLHATESANSFGWEETAAAGSAEAAVEQHFDGVAVESEENQRTVEIE